MNARGVKILAGVVILLVGVLFVLNTTDRRASLRDGERVFPELKERINDINVVTITDAEQSITLQRQADSGRWVVPDRDGYPAHVGNLRQLLLALADARMIERKTADPALYERLGVAHPAEEGGSGKLVTARGDNAAVSLIIGDTAQRDYRYARIPEELESWLIDRNPTLPANISGWLLPEIVNIGASRIQSASIRHSDGETIRIHKQDQMSNNFEVEDIPEGRELSYATVANSLGGVLGNLTLDDVMASGGLGEEQPAVTAEFVSFDGLQVDVSVFRVDGNGNGNGDGDGDGDGDGNRDEDDTQSWITLQASARATNVGLRDETDESETATPDTDNGDAGNAVEAAAADDAAPSDDSEEIADAPADPAAEAAGINSRVGGWAYRIPAYKIDQLTRRWDDILRAEDED